MPMKMSPVSVFYCLRADIRAILKRAGASPASARTANADEKSQPQEQAFKDEDGYARFNRWKKVQSKRTKDQDFELFMKLYRTQREGLSLQKTYDIIRRRRAKRNHALLNEGYKEEEEEFEAEEEEFQDEWRKQSILEDLWKSEYYRQHHRKLREDIPEREPLAFRSDRLADVLKTALRSEYADQNRPVLTHELADFDNPYMMKRSGMERLLHERCVRNQLDERCLPRLLDQHSDLTKLRRQASLPPEVLEPLAAFRGDVRWNFNSRARLGQKLQAANAALHAISESSSIEGVLGALPENQVEEPEQQLEGIHHPWRNHLGFESDVPTGVAGGIKFGQPEPELKSQIARLRYPTLQRVAHTLPSDPKWRAHVVRSIRVLERSKDWDYNSKLNAINRMKEVYDHLKPSEFYTAALDEKLPVNRVSSRIKRKYARDVQYVKTFPKNWRRQKSFTRYRPSLTATAPLKKDKKK
ncbi:unnamed protein product [Symbiodinium microadriaticum]|nr:unnamed protein product [Symbiodinium microadriaticum]